MDRRAILGLACIIGLLAWVVLAGAGQAATVFWRTPSLALVIGGAALTTLLAFPESRPRSMLGVFRQALSGGARPAAESNVTQIALAEIARREGLLALERPVERLDDPFLKRAMRMAIDGYDPSTIQSVMQTEMESTDLRHTQSRGMLESMGRSAPVFGMMGTLIGLVVMLGRLDDPTRIGPGMAVALLTTLYGLVLANVVCLPLARRLGQRSSEELLGKSIVLVGVLAIQAGDHPRVVVQRLQAYLPGSDGDDRLAKVVGPSGRAEAGREQGAVAGDRLAGSEDLRRGFVNAA